jgi:hypothetical protein
MRTYKVQRLYFRDSSKRRTIKTRLSLEEAQAHCSDPETSASTCKKAANMRHTALHGLWFDSYTEE